VETVLHSFGATSTDGIYPNGLILGTNGNLYGTTISGGTTSSFSGTFFEITLGGAETVLYSFGATRADGMYPNDLIPGADGNFYGTTHSGGANTCLETPNSCGTAFEITPEGVETVLYTFGATSADGIYPDGLVLATDGTLYGTTTYGGTNTCPRLSVTCGTVFKITP
jgi:uncharacterized repeat protein (TIGR03803 family)